MSDAGQQRRAGPIRARDADRERVIAVLDTAYVEGQLSAADRERRVTRALTAGTVGELAGLVDDLQHESDPLPPLRSRRGPLVAVAVVAAVVIVAGVTIQRLSASDPEPTPPAPAAEIEPVPPPAPAEPAPPEPAQPVPAHEPLTVPALREFIRAYRDEFDSTEIYDASFSQDGSVDFDAPYGPVRKGRLQSWDWDPVEGFSTFGSPSTNVFEYAPVDLTRVNLKTLVGNVAHARRYLNVDDPDTVSASLNHRFNDADPPYVSFYVSNEFRESGMMMTTLQGRLLRSSPFSPDGT